MSKKLIGYKVRCPNKPKFLGGETCNYEWTYKGTKDGRFKHYIGCPECFGKFNRENNTLEEVYQEEEIEE